MSWIKITTATFTASSAVNIDDCFSASYVHYLITRQAYGSSANADINARLRVGGSDASGTDYGYQQISMNGSTTSGGRTTGLSSFTTFLGLVDSTTDVRGYAIARVSNPFDTVLTTAWWDFAEAPTGSIRPYRRVGRHTLTNSYTGISFIPSSGTITGSITVYGLKE